MDCRPTQSRMVGDHYEVKVDGQWMPIPYDKQRGRAVRLRHGKPRAPPFGKCCLCFVLRGYDLLHCGVRGSA
jgi:hypothetical protein